MSAPPSRARCLPRAGPRDLSRQGAPLYSDCLICFMNKLQKVRKGRYQSASPNRKLLIIIFIKLLFNVIFPYLQNFIRPTLRIKILSRWLLWDFALIFSFCRSSLYGMLQRMTYRALTLLIIFEI